MKRILLIVVLLQISIVLSRTTGDQSKVLPGIPYGSIPKTSFTCQKRGTGYYADVETGCQVYHMCDEQGRQFDYACPNATLFQQRMLICDHWYMVDCSFAEANYGFNSLIGQRDKHFVSDKDAELRTPRPDLLDRPYAADYGGDSYRRQITKSNFPALQNAISGIDLSKNINGKFEILETQASSHVLPPHFNTNSLDPTSIPDSDDFPLAEKNNERRNAFSANTQEVSNSFAKPPIGFEPPNLLPTYNQEFRKREEARLRQLGVSVQSATQPTPSQPLKFSQFPAQQLNINKQPKVQPKVQVVTQAPFIKTTTIPQTTKKPTVRTFDPDKNFKAFEHILQPGKKATHKDYDFSRYFTKKEVNGATTVSPSRFNNQKSPSITTTTRKPISFSQTTTQRTTKITPTVRTQVTFKPFVQTVKPINQPIQFISTTTTRKPTQPTTTQTTRVNAFNKNNQFTHPTVKVSATTTKKAPIANAFSRNSIPANQLSAVKIPSIDFLPPFETIKSYDDATTRGPPIYFEWKVPSSGLIPPKLENETQSIKRSINEEGNFDGSDFQSSESRRTGNRNSIRIKYKDLQKALSIPEYEFPIESNGRVGYENDEAVNSFQVKIPYRQNSQKVAAGSSDRYYYLEHAHCNPECHPNFFKPGRCEPCIKF